MSSPSVARWIPAHTWLRAYDWSWLRSDGVAGITLAAYLLPAALGDASLANLRPEAGLYACLFSGLVFWIFCGSRYTAVSGALSNVGAPEQKDRTLALLALVRHFERAIFAQLKPSREYC